VHEFSFFIIHNIFFLWGDMEAITLQKTSKYYTTEFDLEEGFLNRACISISNLPENIALQTHKDDLRPEARGSLKSGAWGGRPTYHPQTPAMMMMMMMMTRTKETEQLKKPAT
jgi:hypothetical protein